MDFKTKLYTLLAMILFISCHKDKTPEKKLPVLREGIYGLYCNENTSEHFERYFYIKENTIYLTELLKVITPACLNRAAGSIVFSNDTITKPFEITEGAKTVDSCEYFNDTYGANYGIYFLSEGKANFIDWKIASVSGTFTLDYPGYHRFGSYRLVFLSAYPK